MKIKMSDVATCIEGDKSASPFPWIQGVFTGELKAIFSLMRPNEPLTMGEFHSEDDARHIVQVRNTSREVFRSLQALRPLMEDAERARDAGDAAEVSNAHARLGAALMAIVDLNPASPKKIMFYDLDAKAPETE